MENLSHSRKPNRGSSQATLTKRAANCNGATNFSAKTMYDDVFGGPPRFGTGGPTLSPRPEDYTEIFGGFHSCRGASIPVLDLPSVNDNDEVMFDVRKPRFSYAEVFGGFDGLDLASSYEELMRQGNGGDDHDPDDDSSEEAWVQAETESLSEGSDHSGKYQFSNGDYYEPIDSSMEFNISYHKANIRSNIDIANGVTHVAQLHADPEFTYIIETPLQKTDNQNPILHVTDDIDLEFPGGVTKRKHLRKTVSHPSNMRAGEHTFKNDSTQNEYRSNGSRSNEMFVTISEINLRTLPSDVPPPSRPAPYVDAGDGDYQNGQHAASGERMGDNSPPYFDVEIDATSAAAASAAAMKEAMNKAQAKLKSAKELLERKREGIKNSTKLGSNSEGKAKKEKVNKAVDVPGKPKGERVQGKDDSGTKIFIRDERQTSVKAQVSDSLEGEKLFDVPKRVPVEKHGMESRSIQEFDEVDRDDEWQEATQFFELVRTDTSRMGFEQINIEKGFVQSSKSHEFQHKTKMASSGALEQQLESDKKVEAVREDHEMEKVERALKTAKESCERGESTGVPKASKDARRHRGHEKKVKAAQEVTGLQQNGQAVTVRKPMEYVRKPTGADESEKQEKWVNAQQRENVVEVVMPVKEKEKQEKRVNAQQREKAGEVAQLVKEKNSQQEKETSIEYLKRFKEFQEREDGDRSLTEIFVRGKSETKLEQAENEKRMREALEQDEKQRRLKEAREQAENEKRMREALEQEEKERRLKEDREQAENEKRMRQALEQEEKERRLKEAREQAENEKRMREALEQEEKERRLKEAREQAENEKRMREALEQEEKERRLKEAREQAENEKRMREAVEQEEKDRRLKLVRAQEEKEKKEKEACELEESEKIWRMALEQLENEKRQKLVYAQEEHERRQRKVLDQEEMEKKQRETLGKEENESRPEQLTEQEKDKTQQKEVIEREENKNALKEASEKDAVDKELKEASEKEESGKRPEKVREIEHIVRMLQEAVEKTEYSNPVKEVRNAEEFKQEVVEQEETEEPQEVNSVYQKIERCENGKKLNMAEGTHQHVEREDPMVSDEVTKMDYSKRCQDSELVRNNDKNSDELEETEVFILEENGKMETEFIHREEKLETVKTEDDGKLNASGTAHSDSEREVNQFRKDDLSSLRHLDDGVKKAGEAGISVGQRNAEKINVVPKLDSDNDNQGLKVANEWRERARNIKEAQLASHPEENKDKFVSAQTVKESVETGRKPESAKSFVLEGKGSTQRTVQQFKISQSAERKEKNSYETLTQEEKEAERLKRERELEQERLRKIEEEREREREREKDRMAVDRAALEARESGYAEARERAERAAVERATAEARQRAMAEARDRLDKACAEAREKSSMEVRLRAERAAVERATAEARERAVQKAMAERAAFEARERVERSMSDKFSTSSRSTGMRTSSSSSDLQDQHFQGTSSSGGLRYSYSSVNGVEGETAQRCKARLERYRRTAERAAKALEEKNMRDLLAQREQAERNRLAETLDADVKRWSSGKEGNLRALLSTLQYILGPGSGWQPVPLTEVITSAAVKKAYRKATLCVHPDKLQQRGATIQQKYICEKVFDLLKEAWNKFNSEER